MPARAEGAPAYGRPVTTIATAQWREVGDRVLVRRHRAFDLNVGLVLGDRACLVVDTHCSEADGRELAEAVRRVTPDPWVVVDTHAHFDHCFGNAAFRPAHVWGHRRCAEVMRSHGEAQRRLMAAAHREHGRPDVADQLEATRIDPPDELVDDVASLTVGGRPVHLRHLGRGHTDNDLVLVVADAAVLFAGDLVEQGAPPSFEDAFPLDWPATLDALVQLVDGAVVPGHGDVVDRAHVLAQRAEIARAADLARAAYAGGRPVDAALAAMPFPPAVARTAAERAFRQLRGDPPYEAPEQP
jgi:glyoxylase-like metal-dependent hydrolase (beta-lactamase superfamily II)